MLKNGLMLLMILIPSCNTTVSQRIACAQIEKYQIRYVPKCDISFKLSSCLCRCFDYNNWSSVPLNKCERFSDLSGMESLFDLEYCDGIGGSFASDQATEIRPNVKALANVKANLCQ